MTTWQTLRQETWCSLRWRPSPSTGSSSRTGWGEPRVMVHASVGSGRNPSMNTCIIFNHVPIVRTYQASSTTLEAEAMSLPVISEVHPVRIQHWNDLENEMIPQHFGDWMAANQEVDGSCAREDSRWEWWALSLSWCLANKLLLTLHDVRRRRLARMNSRREKDHLLFLFVLEVVWVGDGEQVETTLLLQQITLSLSTKLDECQGQRCFYLIEQDDMVTSLTYIPHWDREVLVERSRSFSSQCCPDSFGVSCTSRGSSRRTGRRRFRDRSWRRTTWRSCDGDPDSGSSKRAWQEYESWMISRHTNVQIADNNNYDRNLNQPLLAARWLHHWWHSFSIQRLRLAKVDHVQNNALKQTDRHRPTETEVSKKLTCYCPELLKIV